MASKKRVLKYQKLFLPCNTYKCRDSSQVSLACPLALLQMDTYRVLVRGQLSRMERQVMSALIVIELHARDVLDGLVANSVPSANDFDWISQLRRVLGAGRGAGRGRACPAG